jgi:hypothetical protein
MNKAWEDIGRSGKCCLPLGSIAEYKHSISFTNHKHSLIMIETTCPMKLIHYNGHIRTQWTKLNSNHNSILHLTAQYHTILIKLSMSLVLILPVKLLHLPAHLRYEDFHQIALQVIFFCTSHNIGIEALEKRTAGSEIGLRFSVLCQMVRNLNPPCLQRQRTHIHCNIVCEVGGQIKYYQSRSIAQNEIIA